jgi:hypothetical protein
VSVAWVSLAGDPPTAAAAVLPAANCGFTMGPITENGAAGTLFFTTVLRPLSLAENCTTSVTLAAAIAPTSPLMRYTNIDNNPLLAGETVSFRPGRLPPSIGVGWGGFHCADPAVPGSLALTVAGQLASVAVSPSTCGPAGSPHSFLTPVAPTVASEVGIARTPDNHGYYTVNEAGSITSQGDATAFAVNAFSNAPVVGIAAASSGAGVWVVASDGGVFTYGTSVFYGSLGGLTLNAPVVGMAATPDGLGYWLVASDGGVFAFGDAGFYRSLGGTALNAPVVGMAPTPDGKGYWMVAADGGLFAFGDAGFYQSLGGTALNAPVVGMAPTPDGKGYWMVAADGGLFTFGDAGFFHSLGGMSLNAPISGMAATSDGGGYWMVGSDNGIFAFGNAGFYGSSPITP